MKSATFLVQRIGPYHAARLNAWSHQRREVYAVEFRAGESDYLWSTIEDREVSNRSRVVGAAGVRAWLEQNKPSVIVCTGYSDPEIHVAMAWALKRQVRIVVCSDSNKYDAPRRMPLEAMKRCLLRAVDAALVAGQHSKDYLRCLGVARERVFVPWDVVDNEHFASGVAGVGSKEGFLCVARFIPKKNLPGLLKAYSLYRAGAATPWPLSLVGAGPLEGALREQVAALGLRQWVSFVGVANYAELPQIYSRAGALLLPSSSEQWGLVVNEAMAAGLPVLVSNRCGCAPDLVRDGENGFAFDPHNVEKLASLMSRVAAISPEKRATMGRRSQEFIAGYSPEAFAAGVQSAVECALAQKNRRIPLLTRCLVQLLALRA